MKLFGQITELAKVILRSAAGNAITVQPDSTTGSSGAVTVELPPKTTGTSELVDTDSTQTLSGKTILPGANSMGVTGALVGTTDTQTLTNKTIAAGSNTISGLVHGTQVDNPSSGVHGVTGTIVGTSDTQTLSNKSISDALTGSQIATPATPSAGSRKIYAKADGWYDLNSSGIETKFESAVTPDLEDLGDVTITAPSNEQILTYSSGTWINKTRPVPVVSSNTGTYTTTSTSYTQPTNLSTSITGVGRPVKISLTPDGVALLRVSINSGSPTAVSATIEIRRDTTQLCEIPLSLEAANAGSTIGFRVSPGAISCIDTSNPIGSTSYNVRVKNTGATGQVVSMTNIAMILEVL